MVILVVESDFLAILADVQSRLDRLELALDPKIDGSYQKNKLTFMDGWKWLRTSHILLREVWSRKKGIRLVYEEYGPMLELVTLDVEGCVNNFTRLTDIRVSDLLASDWYVLY